MTSATKWAVHVDLSLHSSQYDGDRGVVQILGTSASCSICMLPHWHLQQRHLLLSDALAEVLLRKTVEHDKVLSSACSWWRWHTQYRSLWRPDLVTSCLFLVSWIHLAVGTKIILSDAEVAAFISKCNGLQIHKECVSCSPSRMCDYSFSFLTTSHLKHRCIGKLIFFSESFPDKMNITCGISSCMDWQVVTSVWMASHQAIVLKQLPCVCRQTVSLCRQDDMRIVVSPKFVSSDTSAALKF